MIIGEDLTEIILDVTADRASAVIKLANSFSSKLAVLGDTPHIGGVSYEASLRKIGYQYVVVKNYLDFI